MKTNEIKLVQLPIITHQLLIVGKSVTERLDKLDIEKQVATIDTVKSLKDLRAELNKELADFESQRKTIKTAILKPYDELESIYKTEISEKYTSAINMLKDKIAEVETKIKTEKTNNIKVYFSELCASENIDFIKFENLGIEINLSTSEKAYKDKCNEIISKTVDDLKLIKTTDFEAEILVEYKKTLNVSQSITLVKTRKESEAAETERLKQAEKVRRINVVKGLSMVWMDMTNSFEYDNELYITKEQIETLSKTDFQNKIISLEENIKAKKLALTVNKAIKAEVIETPKPSEPIKAPTEEVKEEIVKASFEVTGTMNQLRALGQYMKSNNINYKNI